VFGRVPAIESFGSRLEESMEKFIHDENLKLFRKRLAEAANETDRHIIRELIAEQEAKKPRRTKAKPD
jgi:hypothetical protein